MFKLIASLGMITLLKFILLISCIIWKCVFQSGLRLLGIASALLNFLWTKAWRSIFIPAVVGVSSPVKSYISDTCDTQCCLFHLLGIVLILFEDFVPRYFLEKLIYWCLGLLYCRLGTTSILKHLHFHRRRFVWGITTKRNTFWRKVLIFLLSYLKDNHQRKNLYVLFQWSLGIHFWICLLFYTNQSLLDYHLNEHHKLEFL